MTTHDFTRRLHRRNSLKRRTENITWEHTGNVRDGYLEIITHCAKADYLCWVRIRDYENRICYPTAVPAYQVRSEGDEMTGGQSPKQPKSSMRIPERSENHAPLLNEVYKYISKTDRSLVSNTHDIYKCTPHRIEHSHETPAKHSTTPAKHLVFPEFTVRIPPKSRLYYVVRSMYYVVRSTDPLKKIYMTRLAPKLENPFPFFQKILLLSYAIYNINNILQKNHTTTKENRKQHQTKPPLRFFSPRECTTYYILHTTYYVVHRGKHAQNHQYAA